jgi:hypothetical protein
MKIPKTLRIGLCTLIGVLVLKFLPAAVIAQTIVGEIPSVVRPCIPAESARFKIDQAKLVGSTSHQSKTYYLFKLEWQSQGNRLTYDHVVSVAQNSPNCEIAYSNPMGDDLPLSKRLPRPVAEQLRLAYFRQILNEIGQSAFAERIEQTDFASLDPEEVWALQQLGFTPQ